jgi:hypothetical protein
MKTQYGYGGIKMFRAPPLQRGYGIGGIFKGLFRTVSPFIKKGLLKVGKRALTMGANALDDVSKNNTSFKGAMKNQIMSSLPKGINRGGARNKKVIPRVTSQPTTPKRKGRKSGSKKVKRAKSGTITDIGEIRLRK